MYSHIEFPFFFNSAILNFKSSIPSQQNLPDDEGARQSEGSKTLIWFGKMENLNVKNVTSDLRKKLLPQET
jgi:hypothetical protein